MRAQAPLLQAERVLRERDILPDPIRQTFQLFFACNAFFKEKYLFESEFGLSQQCFCQCFKTV
jgi:hypothetical protein